MTITEFCTGRDIKVNAVSNYIKRHETEFKNLTKQVGKNTILLPGAIELLEKKYPFKKPVVVMDGVSFEEHAETLRELTDAQKRCIFLQEEIRKQTAAIAQAEATVRLLEDRELQLHKLEVEKSLLEGNYEKLRERNEQLSEDKDELKRRIAELERRTLWDFIRRR